VKYDVLAWSPALRTERDWVAYAQHAFQATYGAASSRWRVQVSGGGKAEPRIASAVEGDLIDALRALPAVASIQPYLMAAFNDRRGAFATLPAWFVVQEPGRLTVALVADGVWKAVRSRKVQGDWRATLVDVLEREAAGGVDCDRVLLWSEEEAPLALGRYR